MCKTCVVLYTALVGIPPGLWGRGPVAGVRARAARARRSASGTRDPQTRTHMVWCMRFRSPFIKVPHMCEEITFCRALGDLHVAVWWLLGLHYPSSTPLISSGVEAPRSSPLDPLLDTPRVLASPASLLYRILTLCVGGRAQVCARPRPARCLTPYPRARTSLARTRWRRRRKCGTPFVPARTTTVIGGISRHLR